MKRVFMLLGVLVVLVGAVALSGQATTQQSPGKQPFSAQMGDRNPWTHLRFNNADDSFQFLIITDRTGGHRQQIFSKAVEQINLLQPEFVVSVGDLIEGYTENQDQLDKEWKEFQYFTSKLQMPFFYTPGNHDITNKVMQQLWESKFGRQYYHFVYKNVLFLCLSTEDPPGSNSMSPQQVDYFKKVLDAYPKVRWTMVLLHKPIWDYNNLQTNGFLDLEEALSGRNYTVFAGHRHRYQKYNRNGMDYYQLATTGGGSRLRGVDYGEFDHIVWVTMKESGPVLANVMLDGIYPENLQINPEPETGRRISDYLLPTQPVEGTVYLNGVPAVGTEVRFQWLGEGRRYPSVAKVQGDGSFVLTTFQEGDGAPAGDYAVTLAPARANPGEPYRANPIDIPEAYRSAESTPLKRTVIEGPNFFKLDAK